MSYCDTCGHQYSDVCGGCETLNGVPVKYRKKTHYDEVRAMGIEELGNWLCHIVSRHTVNCANCIASDLCRPLHNGMIEWLKREVSDA